MLRDRRVARRVSRGNTWEIRRHQQHVVEGERFAEKAHGEGSRRKSELYGSAVRHRPARCAVHRLAHARRARAGHYTAGICRPRLHAGVRDAPARLVLRWPCLLACHAARRTPSGSGGQRAARSTSATCRRRATFPTRTSCSGPSRGAHGAAPRSRRRQRRRARRAARWPRPRSTPNSRHDARRPSRSRATAAKADEQKAAAQRADNCQRAREHTGHAGQRAVRIARINDKGEREILDDKARADEMQRAREVIAQRLPLSARFAAAPFAALGAPVAQAPGLLGVHQQRRGTARRGRRSRSAGVQRCQPAPDCRLQRIGLRRRVAAGASRWRAARRPACCRSGRRNAPRAAASCGAARIDHLDARAQLSAAPYTCFGARARSDSTKVLATRSNTGLSTVSSGLAGKGIAQLELDAAGLRSGSPPAPPMRQELPQVPSSTRTGRRPACTQHRARRARARCAW